MQTVTALAHLMGNSGARMTTESLQIELIWPGLSMLACVTDLPQKGLDFGQDGSLQ